MKWGRRRTKFNEPSPSSSAYSSSSSSHPSLFSHVLSKFKQIKGASKKKSEQKPKTMDNFPSTRLTKCVGDSGNTFYSGEDDDKFWRLSFGEETVDGKIRSLRKNVGKEREEGLSNKLSNHNDMPFSEIRTPKKGHGRKDWKMKEEDEVDIARKSVFSRESDTRDNKSRRLKNSSNPNQNGGIDLGWERMKELKIEEIKSRSDQKTHRKSTYLSRENPGKKASKPSKKVQVFTPRTASRVEICKIKALEDMKKAKLKMKNNKVQVKKRRVRKTQEENEEEEELESFAVVKCSFNPQEDFRDSMMEMIMEKRIGLSSSKDLEELLACYLTLNSNEYHDMIIKVFRQVWFDLNRAGFDEFFML